MFNLVLGNSHVGNLKQYLSNDFEIESYPGTSLYNLMNSGIIQPRNYKNYNNIYIVLNDLHSCTLELIIQNFTLFANILKTDKNNIYICDTLPYSKRVSEYLSKRLLNFVKLDKMNKQKTTDGIHYDNNGYIQLAESIMLHNEMLII
jgi:hypothetical protein